MSKRLNAKIKKGIFATIFFLVLCIGTTCFADEVSGTVLGESCNIRETSDPSGKIIGNVKKNGTVSIIGETTGSDGKQWYQIWVDGSTKGYIRADLVKKGDGAVATPSQQTTATTTTTAEPTTATPVEEKTGTVNTNNVRIRKGASTSHDVVATANKGMSLTVTGEATGNDSKKWYQIKFTYNNKEVVGFIRADLVTFGAVSNEPAVSEITGSQVETPATTETEEPTQPETQEPQEQEPAPEPEQPEETNNSSSSGDMTLMNTTDVPYIMSGFVPIILKWNDQDINAFKNGEFYIFFAQNQAGEQGWYVFDSEKGTYQRYAYAVEGVAAKEPGMLEGNLIPIIILVVIIVILLAIVGLLFIKLREYTSDVYDDDDDVEDDEEFDEEEEFIEEEEEVVQKPQKARKVQRVVEEETIEDDRPVRNTPVQSQRPARRPNAPQRPERMEKDQEQRRVRPDGLNTARRAERPVNRGEDGVPVRRENDRPVRRPGGEAPRRRPAGEPGYRRPSGEPMQRRADRTSQEKGYRAQNFLENEDKDDIEFIDL